MNKIRNYASIDIGTNTLRLLIAETSGCKLKPIMVKRVITRLGGDFTDSEGIAEDSMQRAVDTLHVFANIIKEYDAKDVFATATSVVRRARNKDMFIKRVFAQTGIKVNVISGDEEAGLSLLGALSVIKDKNKRCMVVDIGGGSTEFILAEDGRMLGSWSMEMGVVHLTEDYLKSDPPAKDELDAMEDEINRVITELKGLMKESISSAFSLQPLDSLVGTAGTITTLASIDQKLEVYTPEKINNYALKYNAVKDIYGRLLSLATEERQALLSLEKGREDLIIPGAAIVLKTMDAFGFDSMTVSDAGLLEGILIKQLTVNS